MLDNVSRLVQTVVINPYVPCPLQKIKDPANARPLKAFSFSSEEPIRFEVIA